MRITNARTSTTELEIDGIRYSGHHTGLMAYRSGSFAFATDGSQLFVGNQKIELKKIQE